MRTTFRTGASMRSQGEPSAKGARWRFPRGTWGWQPWHRYWESTQTMYEQWTLNIHIWLLEVWPQFHYPQLCFPVINTRGCKQRSTEPEPLSQLANLPIVAEVNYCSRNSFLSIYFQVSVLWWKTSKLVPLQLLLHKKQVTAKLGKISFFSLYDPWWAIQRNIHQNKLPRPTAVGEIAHFDSLRWEDQEKITKRIAEVWNIVEYKFITINQRCCSKFACFPDMYVFCGSGPRCCGGGGQKGESRVKKRWQGGLNCWFIDPAGWNISYKSVHF